MLPEVTRYHIPDIRVNLGLNTSMVFKKKAQNCGSYASTPGGVFHFVEHGYRSRVLCTNFPRSMVFDGPLCVRAGIGGQRIGSRRMAVI